MNRLEVKIPEKGQATPLSSFVSSSSEKRRVFAMSSHPFRPVRTRNINMKFHRRNIGPSLSLSLEGNEGRKKPRDIGLVALHSRRREGGEKSPGLPRIEREEWRSREREEKNLDTAFRAIDARSKYISIRDVSFNCIYFRGSSVSACCGNIIRGCKLITLGCIRESILESQTRRMPFPISRSIVRPGAAETPARRGDERETLRSEDRGSGGRGLIRLKKKKKWGNKEEKDGEKDGVRKEGKGRNSSGANSAGACFVMLANSI